MSYRTFDTADQAKRYAASLAKSNPGLILDWGTDFFSYCVMVYDRATGKFMGRAE